MTQIFISYAAADRQYAEKLQASLQEANVAGRIDVSSSASETRASEDIRTAMKESGAIVVLLSPRSLNNEWLNFEVGAGLALGKQVVPVIVEGPDLEHQVPDTIRGLKLLDARNKPIGEVATDIQAALK